MISIFHKKTTVTNIAWLGVDIHSHLLPGIDDGAKDLTQSVIFIKALNALGFNKLFCTPHIFSDLYPNTPKTILSALDNVNSAIKQLNLNVEISSAAEYMIDETFKISEQLLGLPGKYILIEMSYMYETPNIEQIISGLQLIGYNVILAHPERYGFYHKYPEKYDKLKHAGVFFQLNLLSVSGYYGKHVKGIADNLLAKGSYDFAATDLHHQHHLTALKLIISNGSLYKLIGNYPFKNKEIF
jgi:protein-tyrosine phosphatase